MRGIGTAFRRPRLSPPATGGGGFPNALRSGLSDGAMLVDGVRGSRCRGIAAPRAPGRKPQPGSMGEAVSMGHYPRSLVLGRRPLLIAAGEGGMLAGG